MHCRGTPEYLCVRLTCVHVSFLRDGHLVEALVRACAIRVTGEGTGAKWAGCTSTAADSRARALTREHNTASRMGVAGAEVDLRHFRMSPFVQELIRLRGPLFEARVGEDGEGVHHALLHLLLVPLLLRQLVALRVQMSRVLEGPEVLNLHHPPHDVGLRGVLQSDGVAAVGPQLADTAIVHHKVLYILFLGKHHRLILAEDLGDVEEAHAIFHCCGAYSVRQPPPSAVWRSRGSRGGWFEARMGGSWAHPDGACWVFGQGRGES